MDCLTAQELISDALDRTPVDAEQLAQAKQHCQGCPTCSVFVRTLLLVRGTAPTPPADLADRVMVAIRAEDVAAKQRAATAQAAELRAAAAAEAGEAESAPADVADPDSSSATPEPTRVAPIDGLRRWAAGRSRQGLVLWASAAVVFVAVLGITASAGVRMITTPPGTGTVASDSLEMNAKSSDQLAAPQTAESAAGMGATAAAPAAGSYVTAQGVVFVLSGPSSIATSGLETTTSVNSGFGSDPARTAPAYTTADLDKLYVYDDATKQLLMFNRVVRSYAGVRYNLASAPLSNYGQWPTLPEGITAPTAVDGSPTFVPLAAGPSGTSVYALAGSDSRTGIAVAPGSSPGDPAAGNPNWTWWTPAP